MMANILASKNEPPSSTKGSKSLSPGALSEGIIAKAIKPMESEQQATSELMS
jgi:hypothetical protein